MSLHLRRRRCAGDISGAFADGAILFPLLVALAWQTGASAAVMLATTTAVAYLVTGWLFRLPIPVQPLKSLAITAIAVGASLAEIRVAGAVLGAIFLLILLADVNRLARMVPAVIVHGIQLGLGVILLLKALELLGLDPLLLAAVSAAVLGILGLTQVTGRPVLGGVAVVSLLWGFWEAAPAAAATTSVELRPWVLVALVVPQIALTLTNSVLGTQRTAQAYFGEDARRVTPRRLLGSIGCANLLVAGVGGMPYCHGSGGVTAHVHGGSRSEWSNYLIGSALLVLALSLHFGGGALPAYPAAVQATLLAVVGLFHLRLATPSWRRDETRPVLLVMAGTALLTQDMLAILATGCLLLTVRHFWPRLTEPLWRRRAFGPRTHEPSP
ncbi:MAG: molybdate transporter family protein [Halofilum sp. (in: g-proteobacteria)]|nr:molybdate transporter family protein [Halofilum sp. (in: g-proteobacteria)]